MTACCLICLATTDTAYAILNIGTSFASVQPSPDFGSMSPMCAGRK